MTLQLPSIIKDPAVALIGQKCYTELVENLHLGDVECLKYSLSKGIGLGIVVGGSVMKVPQVLLIWNARSARGLSLPAFTLETLGYAFSLTYSARKGFAFSTYGENFFLTIQNVIVTLLIILYQPSSHHTTTKPPANTTGALFGALVASVVAGALAVVPMSIVSLLQFCTLPLGLFSKVPQIMENARAQSTGQLSAIAVFAQIAGCLARVFTTATEVGDPLVMWGFILALVLNGIIGTQMWMYWGQDDMRGKEKEKNRPSEWLREKPENDIPPPAPEVPAVPVSVASSMASSMAPSTPSGGRRWARKID
jgi:mannose-P-dolichol utilization defect protein 1